MKTIKIILLSLIVFYGCQQPGHVSEQQISAIKATVDTLLNNWHNDAAEANFDQYMGAMDSISVVIGTDATEYWSNKQFEEFCKPHFDKGEAWDFKTLERNIYVSKTADVVWFDELLDTWMGTCRGSGVSEKTGDDWKIKHYIFSIPIPNNDILAVIDIKKENDSVFLSKFNIDTSDGHEE